MKFLAAASCAVLLLAGCSKRSNDTLEAVKQGVIKDIPKDINVGAMDVNVVSATFRGDEADAVVSFAARGELPMMTMNYTMERKNGEWRIKKRAAGDLQKHAVQQPGAPGAGGMSLPEGHPAAGGSGAPAGGSKLPPGHPPLGGKAQ